MPPDKPYRTKPTYISDKWAQLALERQKYKCHSCETPLGPPNPLPYRAIHTKSRREGGGYHSGEDGEQNGENIQILCEFCHDEETKSVIKSVRVLASKIKIYDKWMEENKWLLKASDGKYSFSKLVNTALDVLTDNEWFNNEVAWAEEQITHSESYANSFLQLLEMYNGRQGDDIAFSKEVSDFFRYYRPEWKKIETDDEIDSRVSDEKLRDLLKSVRDEEIETLKANKEAGWAHHLPTD